MMAAFWYMFTRSGVGVSIAFVIFDVATGFLRGAIVQAVLLTGYTLLLPPTRRAFRRQQRQYQATLSGLEAEGDRLQRQIAELERELGIGDES